LGRKAPSPEKKEAVSEDQEDCGQASRPLVIGLKVRRMLKRTSGLKASTNLERGFVGSGGF